MNGSGNGIGRVIGGLPYRMAFAGGWIDQPFVSLHDPSPPGSMVVVSIEPTCRFMDRCGMGTSTRKVATRLWGDTVPSRDPESLVRELYDEENRGRPEPSGSQDMIVYLSGRKRLDYDFRHAGGVFPSHIESNRDPDVGAWLERVVYMVPVDSARRVQPAGSEEPDPTWISRLPEGRVGCFDAIVRRDRWRALGATGVNEMYGGWEAIRAHGEHPAVRCLMVVELPTQAR